MVFLTKGAIDELLRQVVKDVIGFLLNWISSRGAVAY